MKRIEFGGIAKFSEEERDGVGIQWSTGRYRPSMLRERGNQDYWSYFMLIFVLPKNRWFLQVRLKKQPYRNKKEFIIWLRKTGYYHSV